MPLIHPLHTSSHRCFCLIIELKHKNKFIIFTLFILVNIGLRDRIWCGVVLSSVQLFAFFILKCEAWYVWLIYRFILRITRQSCLFQLQRGLLYTMCLLYVVFYLMSPLEGALPLSCFVHCDLCAGNDKENDCRCSLITVPLLSQSLSPSQTHTHTLIDGIMLQCLGLMRKPGRMGCGLRNTCVTLVLPIYSNRGTSFTVSFTSPSCYSGPLPLTGLTLQFYWH